jgi:two-component system, cell cycle response regulator
MNSGAKVLLIDDSVSSSRLVRFWLEADGVQFLNAYNARQGIELAIAHSPDVVLLDVCLDDMDGFEVCRQLKSTDECRSTQIIFLSALEDVEQRARGLDAGATDYVIKPCERIELIARVRAALRTKRLIDLLVSKARIDPLTGLYNRAHFDDQLAQQIALTKRHKRPCSLIMLDIDLFKAVNDHFGHVIGDSVLQAISEIMVGRVRREDVVCRVGGEEFAIITPDVGMDGAAVLAESLRQRVETCCIARAGAGLKLTASFGIADIRSESPMGVVERADAALYRSKNLGRNRITRDEPPARIKDAA